MGGKSTTSTQTVTIPKEVLARYNAVNARAEEVAKQPFQQYGGQFVAGLTDLQKQGMAGVSSAANMAQPYYQTAADMTKAGSQAVGPLTADQIKQYENPYTSSVVDATMKAMRQQQGQDLAQQQAQAIKSGGFGGDRAGISRAVSMGQQDLARAQAESGLRSKGYELGLQTALGQQGVQASNLQRMLAAGQQYGGLGTAMQQAALQGAQAQIGAGTLEQQTQQADLAAKYQQFLQERGFPYQQAQFLANIALGTGQASGSTTTTTQPSGFFSDERLKDNIEPIGQTYDGQPIYRYDYGDGRTQIGLMAQDVLESGKPGVGVHPSGYLTVDYRDATDDAAAMASMGGAVTEPGEYARGGYVVSSFDGGEDLGSILQSQAQSFGPFSAAGVYGGRGGGTPGLAGIVPPPMPITSKMMIAGSLPQQPPSGASQAVSIGKGVADLYAAGKKLKSEFMPSDIEKAEKLKREEELKPHLERVRGSNARGGLIPHYASGGAADNEDILPYGQDAMSGNQDILGDVVKAGMNTNQGIPKPGDLPRQRSGLEDVKDIASIGSSIASIASMLPFSDERLKHNIEPIGETFDGQNIYRYDMGDGRTKIGLMAQEVLQRRPDAVGERDGYLTLDYDRATEGAASPFAHGDAGSRDAYQSGGAKRVGLDISRNPSGSGLSEDFDFRDATDVERLFARTTPSQKQPSVIPFGVELEPGLGLRGRYLQADKYSNIGAGVGFPVGRGRGEIDASYGFVRGVPQAAAKKSIMGRYVIPFADGGEVPRDGYQAGGSPEPGVVPPADIPEDYETKVAKTLGALARIESGGDYGAMGPTTRRGDRAYGKYQIMGANIPSWTEESLGRRMTPEEFLADKEAQEATARAKVGQYIKQHGDPRQAASMWFSGRPIEKAGESKDVLGTTVPRYVSMFEKYYGGDQRSRGAASEGDLPAKGAREAQFRSEEPEKGLSLKDIGEKATSSDFLVPFLSFVGSTLASQRPTLGGALGEGLVGGVAGYQQNRQIQAQLAKGVLDMIKDRFTRSIDDNGQAIWFDKYTGKRANPDQIEAVYAESLRARGVDPKNFGLGAGVGTAAKITPPGTPATPATPTAPGAKPAEGAPGEKAAEGTPGQQAQGAKAWMNTSPDKVNLLGKSQTQVEEYVERYADYYGLTEDKNPAKLRAEITADRARAKAIASLGDAAQMPEAQSLRQSADEKQRRLDTYIREAAALQVGINAETAKYNTQSIGKHNEEVDKRAENYETARANLVRLSNIYSLYSGGRLADVKAQLESYFKDTIGYVPGPLKGQTANYDEALKLALRQAFEIVGEGNLSRAPKASLTEAVQTVPNPSMDPGAVYSLIGRQIGEMDYLMAKDKAWIESGGSVRPSAFNLEYRRTNPNSYNVAVRNAFGEIPVGAKVPKATIESLQKSYGDFTPGSGRAGDQAQAPAQRSAQPSAPAQPVTVRTVEEARALPSGTVFVDPNGVTRRVP